MTSGPQPPAEGGGLYDAAFEHDACGVGFIADLGGHASHALVSDALGALERMEHRGAYGAEPDTGDGAGILIRTPLAFFRERADECHVHLPPRCSFAVGLVFLSKQPGACARAMLTLAAALEAEGVSLAGTRDVPTDASALGNMARSAEPSMHHVFVVPLHPDEPEARFERRLYVARKRFEGACAVSADPEVRRSYVASLSSRTLVYKGMLGSTQLRSYFADLHDDRLGSELAVFHARFSTNTFPSWPRAHPFRMLAHNGEINTLRGNLNWLRARESLMTSPLFEDMRTLLPVVPEGASDSQSLDAVLELLVMGGRTLPHAMMMLVPEAWEKHETMSPEKRAFYEYHACAQEPWDGPAAIVLTDGHVIAASLDRNGLRPARYWVTRDGRVILASEVGVLDVPPADVVQKGRLEPGKMLLVSLDEGRIVPDDEAKDRVARERPYGEWLARNRVTLDSIPPVSIPPPSATGAELQTTEIAFGYTQDDTKHWLVPLASRGEEVLGSMGTDTPLAVLSNRPQSLFDYFQQLFAQVTNPPLDAIREEVVTSLRTVIGPEGNLLDPEPESCHLVSLESPLLDNEDLARFRNLGRVGLPVVTLDITFSAAEHALAPALEALFAAADDAIADGARVLVLSDRGVSPERAVIPALLATAGLHHHLVRERKRNRAALVVETGEAREVHHFAALVGFGASCVNPWLALDAIGELVRSGDIEGVDVAEARKRYLGAVKKGVLKVMSKMGISTIDGYRGAQIFEAIGLAREVVDRHFAGTPSRIGGIDLDGIEREALCRHERAFGERQPGPRRLPVGGAMQWRQEGEYHLFNPDTVARLQHATRAGSMEIFREYTQLVDEQSEHLCTLRGLFQLARAEGSTPVPLDEVEPVSSIVKRFATGAMSYGSISAEAHETLAIAMNRLGARSNSGEGGEDAARYVPLPNGDSRRSAVKQVASARFGVTSEYLVNADELQIKIAQGAKPGEGGQLPGHKVYPWIAKVRFATEGVGLISPPPHHDIYSIEDLAELIFDLKNANPRARVSVKLVSEVGVGTVAAGVAKAKADVILIAGHDGGTGASPLTSLKHAGAPWELGLADAQQTLVANGLRDRVILQVDGQMRTGRDVVIGALLGAEEFGFATAPLVVMGCVMMRVCHLDTCPVGIATQNPELRSRFTGRAEHVMRFFQFVAEQVREQLALLGFRRLDEIVGRSDLLSTLPAVDHFKARGLDLSRVLARPTLPGPCKSGVAQQHALEEVLDRRLIARAGAALEHRQRVTLAEPVGCGDRAVGTMLGSEVTRRHGGEGLPDDTIDVTLTGSAGQSLGAFLPRGITLRLEGDANDYVGKGLSGGRIVVRPARESVFAAEDNVLIGNVALYGATSGELWARGVAGERFAVRNSGALAVVEGIGDHGCEYMTGGRVVVLGKTGRNFGAGMSGGLAYVLDDDGAFAQRCNKQMIELGRVETPDEQSWLRGVVTCHAELTDSALARRIVADWNERVARFVRVLPKDYARVLAKREKAAA